jgi:hypothetical protein
MNVSKFNFVLSPNVVRPPKKVPPVIEDSKMDVDPQPDLFPTTVVANYDIDQSQDVHRLMRPGIRFLQGDRPRYRVIEPVDPLLVPPPSEEEFIENYETTETKGRSRLSWMNQVRNYLLGLKSGGTCLEQLKQTLYFGEIRNVQVGDKVKIQQVFRDRNPPEKHIVNSGVVSPVYKAYLRNSRIPYPLAIKYFPEISENAQTECVVMPLFDSMVELNICPHYVLLAKSFICFATFRPTTVNIVQEYATMSVDQLLLTNQNIHVGVFYSLILQTFMGLFCSHMFLGVVHNDIKFDNILLNKILFRTNFQYDFFEETLTVPTLGYLFKIADWGLATGNVVKREHDYAPNLATETFNIGTTNSPVIFESTTANIHPLAFRVEDPLTHTLSPISPWKRDYLSFCYMLLRYKHYQRNLPVFLLHDIITKFTDSYIMSPSDLIGVFKSIFRRADFHVGLDAQENRSHTQRFRIQNAYPLDRAFLVDNGVIQPSVASDIVDIYTSDALKLYPGPVSLVLT